MSDLEHRHDWRRCPNDIYRITEDGVKAWMVRCASCPTEGWGREPKDVSEWPHWVGVVDIETEQL